MFRDLRYSLRSLLKRPGFTLVVVATLALGIGVNAAIFSVFNLLLRPLPVKEPESIVRLFFEEGSRRADQFSFPDYSYIRDHNQSFSDVIAVYEDERFLLGENRPNSDPEEILGNFVSENYFAMLGGSTHLGRFFTTEENSVPGRDAVVVLSHGFWQRRFGSDAQLVGSSIKLNGKPFTVIGITHPEFIGLRHEMPDIWLPLAMRGAMPTDRFEGIPPEKRDWYGGRDFPWLSIFARLKPGRTAPEARTEMNVLLGQFDTQSSTGPKKTIAVDPINDLKVPIEAWMFIGMVLGATASYPPNRLPQYREHATRASDRATERNRCSTVPGRKSLAINQTVTDREFGVEHRGRRRWSDARVVESQPVSVRGFRALRWCRNGASRYRSHAGLARPGLFFWACVIERNRVWSRSSVARHSPRFDWSGQVGRRNRDWALSAITTERRTCCRSSVDLFCAADSSRTVIA